MNGQFPFRGLANVAILCKKPITGERKRPGRFWINVNNCLFLKYYQGLQGRAIEFNLYPTFDYAMTSNGVQPVAGMTLSMQF